MDAVIIKSKKDDVTFDNVSFIVNKKFGLTDGTVIEAQLDVIWDGKLFPSMLAKSSEQIVRLFYNNNRPTKADNGSGKRMMSDAEVERRETFLKSIVGTSYIVKASEIGIRTAKAKELTYAELTGLLQTGTEEQKVFAAAKVKALFEEGDKAKVAYLKYEAELKVRAKALADGLKSGITVRKAVK